MRTVFISLLSFIFLHLSVYLVDLSTTPCALASSESGEKAEKAEPSEVVRKIEDIIPLLQQAIDTRDAGLADSLIDFDKLTGAFLKDTQPIINEAVISGKIKLQQPLPVILSGMNGGGNARKNATIFMGAEVKKFVLYGVQSGYFAGHPLPPEELNMLDGGFLLTFFADKGLGRKIFEPGFLVFEDEKQAMVNTALYDEQSKSKIALEVLMQKRGNTLVIIRIENSVEILSSLLGVSGVKQK
ncbi:MAG: hypothetical protein LBV76_00845 [Deltaproteobacteria bacterium]|jgi:hypothetical protein|nr:hypothetical protein [Deltaproteobacteria bacterium]